MKIEFNVQAYITFSFDIPSEYEKLVGAKFSEVAAMSIKELEERERYFDKMYEVARQIINNDFKESTINDIQIDEVACSRVY